MTDHSHPPRDSPDWDRPDYCPFCGAALADGKAGFIDHIEDAPTRRGRFETWRENVAGEWGGYDAARGRVYPYSVRDCPGDTHRLRP